MAHFGSSAWPAGYGSVASLATDDNGVLAATAVTAVEGTDLLTYSVDTTGLYKLTSYLYIDTASTGDTHTLVTVATWNDGAAVSATSIGVGGLTPGTVDAKSADASLAQEMTVYAKVGTDITMAVSEAVAGTGAAGLYDIRFAIERVM